MRSSLLQTASPDSAPLLGLCGSVSAQVGCSRRLARRSTTAAASGCQHPCNGSMTCSQAARNCAACDSFNACLGSWHMVCSCPGALVRVGTTLGLTEAGFQSLLSVCSLLHRRHTNVQALVQQHSPRMQCQACVQQHSPHVQGRASDACWRMQIEGQTEEDLAFLMQHDPDDFCRCTTALKCHCAATASSLMLIRPCAGWPARLQPPWQHLGVSG